MNDIQQFFSEKYDESLEIKFRSDEGGVEDYLVRRTKAIGCKCYKLKPIGIKGFPDRSVLAFPRRIYFCECKDWGKRPDPAQVGMHAILRAMGFDVLLIDSKDKVKELEMHIQFNITIPADSRLHMPEPKAKETRKRISKKGGLYNA